VVGSPFFRSLAKSFLSRGVEGWASFLLYSLPPVGFFYRFFSPFSDGKTSLHSPGMGIAFYGRGALSVDPRWFPEKQKQSLRATPPGLSPLYIWAQPPLFLKIPDQARPFFFFFPILFPPPGLSPPPPYWSAIKAPFPRQLAKFLQGLGFLFPSSGGLPPFWASGTSAFVLFPAFGFFPCQKMLRKPPRRIFLPLRPLLPIFYPFGMEGNHPPFPN